MFMCRTIKQQYQILEKLTKGKTCARKPKMIKFPIQGDAKLTNNEWKKYNRSTQKNGRVTILHTEGGSVLPLNQVPTFKLQKVAEHMGVSVQFMPLPKDEHDHIRTGYYNPTAKIIAVAAKHPQNFNHELIHAVRDNLMNENYNSSKNYFREEMIVEATAYIISSIYDERSSAMEAACSVKANGCHNYLRGDKNALHVWEVKDDIMEAAKMACSVIERCGIKPHEPHKPENLVVMTILRIVSLCK